MTKLDWVKLHEILSQNYSNFRTDYYNLLNGKNKKIRDRASYNVDNEIDLAKRWIEQYPNSFDLMKGGNASGFDRQIVWDEFLTPYWFNLDMPDFLTRMEKKIDSLK